jgi:E3 ubiquitin-protein ligase DMA1/2
LEEDVEVDGDLMDVEEDDEDDVSEVGLDGGDAEATGAMSSGGLVPPAKETGAETEVEGEGGNGGAGPSRMRVSTPLTDDVQEEDLVLVERVDSDAGGAGSGGEAMEVDGAGTGADTREMGSTSPMDDVDGTVGGKRKR